MKRFVLLSLAALACAGSAYACNISADQDRLQVVDYVRDGMACLDTPPEGFRFDEAIEQAFIKKMNAERRREGLPALKRRDALRPAAGIKASTWARTRSSRMKARTGAVPPRGSLLLTGRFWHRAQARI